MQHKDKNHEESIITLSDLVHIFKTHRVAIVFASLLCCLFAAGFSLARPILYNIEGTFKDKGSSAPGMQGSLSLLLNQGSSQTEGEALGTIKSRNFMEKLIYRRGLQGNLIKMEPRFDLFGFIPEHLMVEYAHFMHIRKPVLADRPPTIWAQSVAYNDEVPKGLSLRFLNEHVFEIADISNGQVLGERELGENFSGNGFAFTIMRKSSEPLAGTNWYLELVPLQTVVDGLMGSLTIESDRNDRSLLHLKLLHPNRHVGTEILNSMMLIYQEHIRHDKKRISKEQIAYLEKRQQEMDEKLRKMMKHHAQNMSDDISLNGFANSLKAMEFYGASQSMYQQRLFDIELSLRRLLKAQEDEYAFYEHGDPGIINHHLAEIRALKQQSDALDLALKDAYSPGENPFHSTFNDQLVDLDNVKKYHLEATRLLKSIQNNEKLPLAEHLCGNHKLAVKAWCDRLLVAQNNIENAFSKEEKIHRQEELQSTLDNFASYLSNLVHLFDVQEKVIQERLAFQQSPQKEFQGIDLATSRELYVNYNRILNEVQGNIRQLDFMIEQLKRPDFEITSMSSIPNDFVTNDMVSKASQIVQSMKDTNNRSTKELERSKEQLDVQKEFLTQHLNQIAVLQKIKETLTKEKITSLQSETLGLLRQQISIVDKHMHDYIGMRMKDLQQEIGLIEQHKDELRNIMKDLPNKWVEERMIDIQVLINQKMVEEATALVESKNLQSNLEILQSYPQDFAIPPLHPKSPRSILYAFFGAFLGAFVTFTFFIVKSALHGIQISASNLKANHLHVSGALTPKAAGAADEPLLDQDLDTLRRMVAYLSSGESSKKGQTLVLLNGTGVDYSRHLANLIARRGLKVLLIPIIFKKIDKDHSEGLIQYLEGHVKEPKISHESNYDCIYEGSASRYVSELISSVRFKDLLTKLAERYDWIILASDVMPVSGQGEVLVGSFDHAALSLNHESIVDLKPYMNFKEDSSAKKKITYVLQK